MPEYDSSLLPDALRNLIAINPKTGCWLWLGRCQNGYGVASLWREGIAESQVHVIVYRLLVGEVPAGHHLHHNCEVRRCCNPNRGHVQALTPSEHQLWHVKQRELKKPRR
jgi:hypothetical protein